MCKYLKIKRCCLHAFGIINALTTRTWTKWNKKLQGRIVFPSGSWLSELGGFLSYSRWWQHQHGNPFTSSRRTLIWPRVDFNSKSSWCTLRQLSLPTSSSIMTHKLAIFKHFPSWLLSFFFHTQHKCFYRPAPCRQTALPSPPPDLSNELLRKKKKFFRNFFSHKFCPKATGVSGPLQSVAGRAITERASLFSTGITGGMIILLCLIILCL